MCREWRRRRRRAATSYTAPPKTYVAFQLQACWQVKVTALNHVTMETPHDTETLDLWQTEKDR